MYIIFCKYKIFFHFIEIHNIKHFWIKDLLYNLFFKKTLHPMNPFFKKNHMYIIIYNIF